MKKNQNKDFFNKFQPKPKQIDINLFQLNTSTTNKQFGNENLIPTYSITNNSVNFTNYPDNQSKFKNITSKEKSNRDYIIQCSLENNQSNNIYNTNKLLINNKNNIDFKNNVPNSKSNLVNDNKQDLKNSDIIILIM